MNCGTPPVVRIERRPASQPVYNLEVQVDHVYDVGNCGLLVHNGGLTLLDNCFRASNRVLGEAGESAAADYLRNRGYEILGSVQNSRGHGIDLIAEYTTKHGQKRLVFVEVKANSSRLSPAQAEGGLAFGGSRIDRAINKWKDIDPDSRALAETISQRMLDGENVKTILLRVDLSDPQNPLIDGSLWNNLRH